MHRPRLRMPCKDKASFQGGRIVNWTYAIIRTVVCHSCWKLHLPRNGTFSIHLGPATLARIGTPITVCFVTPNLAAGPTVAARVLIVPIHGRIILDGNTLGRICGKVEERKAWRNSRWGFGPLEDLFGTNRTFTMQKVDFWITIRIPRPKVTPRCRKEGRNFWKEMTLQQIGEVGNKDSFRVVQRCRLENRIPQTDSATDPSLFSRESSKDQIVVDFREAQGFSSQIMHSMSKQNHNVVIIIILLFHP
mmetsp:Transcript_5769/g.13818  ORF Transcript_5769/g.13818 Transcript_5769/m.13818 type:complete len:248 (+) Transcript_5769:2400-3143(+)